MDRVIDFRRPTGELSTTSGQSSSTSSSLSKSSKVFFMLNIVQVVAVGSLQSTMMIVGDFQDINKGGMGPGRRLYMAIFCVSILYTCFLCLFAVKSENFLEILAFVLQNFGFITYSFVQVYHIKFKIYHGLSIKKDKTLAFLAIANCVTLIVLNIIFTFLAHRLFIEYGWKIYKRVRFNVRLRAAYHYYELAICLMKMTLMFVLMFAICLNRTILRDFPESVNYIASLCFVPITLFMCLLALYGIRKENRIIIVIFLITLVTGQGFGCYEIYSVSNRSCNYCQQFYEQTIDIPEEVILHVVYLASMALLMMFLLTLATLKSLRNFGTGLKDHFIGHASNPNILLMGFPRELMRSFFSNSLTKSESFTNLPDVTRSNVIVNTPALVISNSSSNESFDLENIDHSLSQTSDDDSSTNANLNVKQAASISKSNSMPNRMSDQQRPSVMERISQQASSRLHELYYRTVSIESEQNICGCCFWKKKHAVNSFRVSFDMDGYNLSDIFGEYFTGENMESPTSKGFYNACFAPDDEVAEALYSQMAGASRGASGGRYQQRSYHQRVSGYRRDGLVADVIVEECEDVSSPLPSNRSDTMSKTLRSGVSRTLSNSLESINETNKSGTLLMHSSTSDTIRKPFNDTSRTLSKSFNSINETNCNNETHSGNLLSPHVTMRSLSDNGLNSQNNDESANFPNNNNNNIERVKSLQNAADNKRLDNGLSGNGKERKSRSRSLNYIDVTW